MADPTLEVVLLGTGSPIPDANRAGPSALVRAGAHQYLVDCGRAVLMRRAGADLLVCTVIRRGDLRPGDPCGG